MQVESTSPAYEADNAAVASLYAQIDNNSSIAEQERILERAIRLQPRNGHHWLELGLLRQRQQHCDQAYSMAQRALRLELSRQDQQRANDLIVACQAAA